MHQDRKGQDQVRNGGARRDAIDELRRRLDALAAGDETGRAIEVGSPDMAGSSVGTGERERTRADASSAPWRGTGQDEGTAPHQDTGPHDDADETWPEMASSTTGALDEGRSGGGRHGGRQRGDRGRRRPGSAPSSHGAAATGTEADPEKAARAIALRLLTGAPRSRAQLAEAMARRDVPEEVAERVLDRFTEVGLVDDAAYAEVLVRNRHAERGLSRRALALELRRRGVDEATAAEALEQVDDEDEEQAARSLARRRLTATRGLDRETRLRRAYAALGRKGYGGALVSRVVREELAAEGPGDADPWADEPLG